jgi:C-terminal processing protease CtpA/Prc
MKYLQHTFWAFLLTVLCSCGEDRTGEFYALIEDRQWIEETMQANYLWAEDMPVIENEDDYFKEPQTFFKSLLSKNALNGKGDKYSYMEEDPKAPQQESRSQMLDRTSTYGMEFELTNDPTGTTNHIHAHVLYVLDGSPAQQAGITRGDWLSSVDGQRITTSNYQLLKNGGSIKVARTRIYSTELGYTWQPADTLNLAASITMEINPFLIDTLYQVEGQRIAYLMYNEFSTGPENKGTEETYNEQMKAIFANFKAQQPDALILDLRYNNGGYLQCAQALGSLVAPASALGKNFVNLQFNAKANPQRKAYPLLESYAEANLNLGKVYILTTSHTASASEALINGLIPYMGKENVILIGERTEGKNVAMTAFRNETYGITLWPVVAYTSNAEDFSDYGDGFEPTHELKERNIVDWYPLGDIREYLLKNAISLITTGSIADNL